MSEATMVTTASDKSVSYLRLLFEERYGAELTDDQLAEYPTQAEVSGAIKTLLRDEGVIEASDEAKAEVVQLGIDLGMTIVPGATQAAVNRQLRQLRKDTQRRAYTKGASNFEAFLATLKPAQDEARAGF